MTLTLVTIMVLLAGALLAQMNASSLHAPLSLSIPGISVTPPSNLRALGAAGGVVVLLWAAGVIDLIVLRGHVRRRDALLKEKEQEIARVKASAYDQEQPALAEMRTQLNRVALDVNAMMIRLRAMPVRSEVKTITPERSAEEPVAVAD